MKLMNRLRTLWRKLFPVRVVLVYRDRTDGIPSAFNDMGEPEGFDAMLPELVEAYSTCAPVFRWLAMEIARKDKQYHALPPVDDPVKYEAWRRAMEGLNAQLSALNRAVRIPLIANRRVIELQKLAESKKLNEAQAKALEEFFEE